MAGILPATWGDLVTPLALGSLIRGLCDEPEGGARKVDSKLRKIEIGIVVRQILLQKL
jgi:hypothetical protein